MSRKWMVYVLMPVLALVVWGCPKKKPQTPEPELEVVTTPMEEPTEVEPPPPPPMEEEMTEPELPQDIVELNAYVEREGLIGDVFFDFDKSELRPEARQRLENNARFMREHPELTFTIEGHCDERGTNEYNIALGQRRASTTADYLTSLGIDTRRFKTISYGEERPFCTESTEACWQRNRRAHFVISGRQ
jgi:peptidoglycan-associated lipoprotein